ncbi:MFS multidrug transporter-like protein [Lophiostoma macrostomum CBS 122681]|uniref:MFS multidrug transporter-like protein n=1 Tax=Lophiostoma macrostomum CBS 122681 TaxID=1314788 RepID=A0A6A6SS22_9PLEO|nr:MFS multidrug transporter-like protein [Lophiostoma macrostomum CBS 122681]
MPKWRLICLYISICCGLFLSFLDTSIIATALYTIGVSFTSLTRVTWIALAYTLAYIGCTALFASLSDVFGRRNTYIAAFTIFLAFSLACGWAQSLDQLIAFRALQGVGGAGLYSIAFVILPEISGVKMLGLIGAVAGMVVAVSGILGPVLGGVITGYTTWRWIFWINAPLAVGPLVLFTVAWPSKRHLRSVEKRSLRQLDLLGFLLLIAASVPFVFAFQEAGIHALLNRDIWKARLFIAPLVFGVACFFVLGGWEWYVSRRQNTVSALFPTRLAKNRVYVSALVAITLGGFPYFVLIYSLPIRFQVVNGHSALASGVALLPMLGSSAIGSTIGGIASRKKNNTFPTMLLGSVLMLIGTAALTTLSNVVHTEAKAYGLQVFVGLGFGLTISTSSLIAGVQTEIRDNAVGQGLMAQMRMMGGSIGIAASTAILAVKQRQQLLDTDFITPEQLQSLRTAMASFSTYERHAVRQAYTDAFNETLVVCAIISGVSVITTLGVYQTSRWTMDERRKQQFANEALRQQALEEMGRGD